MGAPHGRRTLARKLSWARRKANSLQRELDLAELVIKDLRRRKRRKGGA